MSDYADIKARFEAETKQHVMTVLHDDGLHRHLRFVNPKDSAYWFEIVTWPGSLTLRGDLNDAYTFTRLTDMFEFFRGKRVNPHYWAEKLGGQRKQVQEFSEDAFHQTVKDQVANEIRFGDAPRGIGKAVREQILDVEVCDRESAIELVEAFDFEGYEFDETWEWNLTDYDWSFVWACHALVWAIAQYDQAKADRTERYEGELAHLRSLLATLQRLDSEAGEHSLVRELLINHYSDARIVDPELTKAGEAA